MSSSRRRAHLRSASSVEQPALRSLVITFLALLLGAGLSCSDGRSPSGPQAPSSPATEELPADHFDREDEEIEIVLPGVDGAASDQITIPNGRPVYAILVTGYGSNADFKKVFYYRFAEYLKREWNAYVHWSWWNNLLGPYLERPLHDATSNPASPERITPDLIDFPWLRFVPIPLPDGTFIDKANPDEDFQMQADLRVMLTEIRAHNPCAMIVLVGHSMGGCTVARFAENTPVLLDIVAPIDPVGNRSLPHGLELTVIDGYKPYNWTRSRATHEDFKGYKVADCSSRDPRTATCSCLVKINPSCIYGVDCIGVGPWRNLPAILGKYPPSLAPVACPIEFTDRPPQRTFSHLVVNLYHRYQKEWLFPFDYSDDRQFIHNFPPGGGSQQNAVTLHDGETMNGHEEIIGKDDGVIIDWTPNTIAKRRAGLMAIGSDGAPAPEDPDACLVSPGMVSLFERMNKPPHAVAGPDQVVECTGPDGARVDLDGSGSIDSDGDDISYVWTGPFGVENGEKIRVSLPVGIHTIKLRVSDPTGHVCEDEVEITVVDPPPVLAVSLNPVLLWPPNHEMVDIEATVEATDACGEVVSIELVSITSNESGNERGDGNTSDDVRSADFFTMDTSFQLRAERSGKGDGRIYTVSYRATDDAGGVTVTSAEVWVPHQQGI